ncbi:hypothetical protein BpHYR1_046076, partial [Brachionus plicatilis]
NRAKKGKCHHNFEIYPACYQFIKSYFYHNFELIDLCQKHEPNRDQVAHKHQGLLNIADKTQYKSSLKNVSCCIKIIALYQKLLILEQKTRKRQRYELLVQPISLSLGKTLYASVLRKAKTSNSYRNQHSLFKTSRLLKFLSSINVKYIKMKD